MPDDARTRAHEALFSAFGSDGSIMHVNPYEAVDALIAAGWAPPPAPFNPYHTETGNTTPSLAPPPALASDDVKARATSAVRIAWATEGGAYDSDELRIAIAVDALAAAGLLAAPSHLDRLAAWAAAEPMERSFTVDATGTGAFIATVGLWSQEGRVVEIDTDPQEAARRVLARLEATDE